MDQLRHKNVVLRTAQLKRRATWVERRKLVSNNWVTDRKVESTSMAGWGWGRQLPVPVLLKTYCDIKAVRLSGNSITKPWARIFNNFHNTPTPTLNAKWIQQQRTDRGKENEEEERLENTSKGVSFKPWYYSKRPTIATFQSDSARARACTLRSQYGIHMHVNRFINVFS